MLLILFRIIVNWYYVILLFSGFVGDQREYNDRMNNKTHPPVLKSGPGMIEPVERFRLNNLSFAGPVIMGVGGKKFGTVLLTGSNNQYRIYESRFFMPFKPIIVFFEAKLKYIPKLYTPSIPNIDLILWHTHWIVCAVKLITRDLIHDFHFTF